MTSAKPTREQADLAEVLELVLDKGIVINADIAVTVGETELLGVELRAAIASFETAAEYGLAFPSGTDMRRVEQASGREALEEGEEPIDLGIDASSGGSSSDDGDEDEEESDASGTTTAVAPATRPTPTVPTGGEDGGGSADADAARDDADQDDADQDDADADADQDDADADADQDDATQEADAGTEDA